MSVLEVLAQLGGTATTAQLLALTSRAAFDRAVAHRLAGTVSHTSAALAHGWAVKTLPEHPHVTLPRNRRAPARPGAVLPWADLREADLTEGGLVTAPERTLVDCLRTLPFDEALAVADSAPREGFGSANLAAVADGVRGARAARAEVRCRGCRPA